MTVSLIMAFLAVSFLFVITPGIDWAFAISAGLRGRVLPAVVGMLCGHLVATLIVAAGVGEVLVKIPYALLTLTLMGGRPISYGSASTCCSSLRCLLKGHPVMTVAGWPGR